MLGTGTMKRIPSIPATRPPPHARASAMPACAAISHPFAGAYVSVPR